MTTEALLTEIIDVDSVKKTTVVEYLNKLSYLVPEDYVPSDFALEFLNFIKFVNAPRGEENASPVVHMWMLDQIVDPGRDGKNIANLCSRGLAKTTVLAEYMFLYLAVYNKLPGFGKVPYALYVSDSIENGVKKMRNRLERRCQNSPFLKKYIKSYRFTDIRWYFENIDGGEFVVTGHGAKTGVRGTVELNTRPHLAVLDDLISDEDARSATVIASVEDTVYKAITFALHPEHNLILWSGTPFNARDPLYKAVESGAWAVNVFPVCEMFPCTRDQFRGAWEDRFNYDYVLKQYNSALLLGKIDTFNQELMLRIMSEEDRLIKDHEIQWYDRKILLESRHNFNFYITTDFATSEKTAGDFSVISVWAVDSGGNWYWVDGICKRQLMDKNIDDLFRLAQEYKPQSVGVEVSGQQKGFIVWIQNEMMHRNMYFTLASDKKTGEPGIRPNTDKMTRFNLIVPLFKAHKMFFPKQLKYGSCMVECYDELTLASPSGFKSKKDDFIDTISMLGAITVWRPDAVTPDMTSGSDIYGDADKPNTSTAMDSYIV